MQRAGRIQRLLFMDFSPLPILIGALVLRGGCHLHGLLRRVSLGKCGDLYSACPDSWCYRKYPRMGPRSSLGQVFVF